MFENFNQLLKKATKLKKEHNYLEAIKFLKKAISKGKDEITISQKLRLPTYLKLAGKFDEAWVELLKIKDEVESQEVPFEVISVYSNMSSLAKSEGRCDDAFIYNIIGIIKDINKEYKIFQLEQKKHRQNQKNFGENYLSDWGEKNSEDHIGQFNLERFQRMIETADDWFIKSQISEKKLKNTSFISKKDELINLINRTLKNLPLIDDENLLSEFLKLK